MTKDTAEFSQFTESVACREYTLPRDEEASQPKGWIQGNIKIGLVNRIPLDTAIHEQNGYAKVYDDKYTFITNVDNCDTTYTDKHKHNMCEV